jgi:putative nucleotidyltransferase with HDIG domain
MSDKTKIKILPRAKPAKKTEREASVMGKQSSVKDNRSQSKTLKWLLLTFVSLAISLLLFPNVLTKPKVYGIGDVAERDIKASSDFLIKNEELTEKDREKAVKEVLSVYDFDSSGSNLIPRVKEAFSASRKHLADSFPMVNAEKSLSPSEGNMVPVSSVADNPMEDRFFTILEIPLDERGFDRIMKLGFPADVEESIIRLISPVLKKGVVGNRMMLMSQIEKGGIILHEISTQKEVKVTDSNRFYDLEEARNYMQRQKKKLKESVNSSVLAEISIEMAQTLLVPNLTFNQRETELRKDIARRSIKPVYFKIKKGEMLVREGERITPDHLLKLSEENRSQERKDMLGRLPAMAVLLGILLSVINLVAVSGAKSFRGDGKEVLFMSITLLMIFLSVWAYNFVAEELARGFHYLTSRALLFAMPVACGAMLISIFHGIGIAVAFSFVISVLSSLLIEGRIEFLIYFFVNSVVAAYGVRSCSDRGTLIKTGIKVGLVNIILSLSIEVVYGSLHAMEAFVAAASGFVGGSFAGIIATGILPLIEMSFGFTTDIKLLELANLDQPLLRGFMVQAPGTYHHSVVISNMVEATAKAVQANPLLAKVSAYYHDIGKMKKPRYFIENQIGCENKHEKLAPSMSSLILTSHVKDGVELAREHKLGREIIDIIQQHHGTSLISFFFEKAKARVLKKGSKSTEIKEEGFRYPGPKPQTKEAGLVMLADMVEAASRSLIDPTPSRMQGMVQKIINKVFSDGQLDECELTLKDLHVIAKSFNKTLSGIFHHRVEYPGVTPGVVKKAGNGNTNQLSAEGSGFRRSDHETEVEEGLKRLGLL